MTDRTFAAEAERVARADAVTVDIESDGLDPWAGARAVGVAVEVDGRAAYFPGRHEGGGNLSGDRFSRLVTALRGKRLRGWNLRFDLTMLSFEPGAADLVALGTQTDDGIIDALLMDENESSFSLESIAEKYLGAGAGESKRKMDALLADRFPKLRSARARKANLWRLPAHEVADYACGDVLLPLRLREKYAPALSAWGLTDLAREMNSYSLLLARMQLGGVPIDVERCRLLSESTEARKVGLLAQLRQVAGPKFNPNSWQQVVALTGLPDAQEETLARSDHPVARGVIDYKKLGKAKSAYYDAILRLVDADGVLHPQLNLTRDPTDVGGTRTARLSCSRPNFQALPHPDDDPNAIYKVRDLVVPRPGFRLAKLDYERAEMWMGASYCREPRLIEAYRQRRDIYAEMASELGITRQQAKILFLMLQYGAGVWKVAAKMGWSEEKAKQVRARFFALYPAIKRAMYAYSDQWKSDGSLRLWTGRAIHYGGDAPYAAWNRMIQGAVGEMIRRAMQTLEPLLAALGARMLLQVHDELLVMYPAERERDVVKLCVDVMTGFDGFLLRPRVEPKISGTNYAEMQAYEEAA